MFKQDPFFCILPWVHMHTWPNQQVSVCCLSPHGNHVGDASKDTLQTIWNNEHYKSIRKDFLNGKVPSNCRSCYQNNRNREQAPWKTFNKKFINHFDKLSKTQEDGTLEDFNLIYWDFRISNICNFKCRMCNGFLSSSWEEEIGKRLIPKYDTVPYWEEIKKHIQYIESIYFAGGEPLLTAEHYYVLNRLIELDKIDVDIDYSTNLSRLTYKKQDVVELWKKFSNVRIMVSLDGMNEVGEYVRTGMVWDDVVGNINRVITECPHIKWIINCTVSIYNIFHIIEFDKWIRETKFIAHDIHIQYAICYGPKYLSINNLPDSLKEEANDYLIAYGNETNNKQFFELSEHMMSSINCDYDEVKKFVKNLDKVRNTDLRKISPKVGNWIYA